MRDDLYGPTAYPRAPVQLASRHLESERLVIGHAALDGILVVAVREQAYADSVTRRQLPYEGDFSPGFVYGVTLARLNVSDGRR